MSFENLLDTMLEQIRRGMTTKDYILRWAQLRKSRVVSVPEEICERIRNARNHES